MVEFIYFLCLLGVTSRIFAIPLSSANTGEENGISADVVDVEVPGQFLMNYENLLNSDEDLSYPILPLPRNPPQWLMTLIHQTEIKSSEFSNRQKRAYPDYSNPRLQAILRAFYSTYGYDNMNLRYGRSVRSVKSLVPIQHRIFHNSFLKQMKADTHSRGRIQRSIYRRPEIQKMLRMFYSRGKFFGNHGLRYG